MPTIKLDVDGLRQADAALRRFGAGLSDWRPYWAQLGERLADEAQARWPLKRRTGKLRKSLTWAGTKLGAGGIFEASPDQARVWEQRFLRTISSIWREAHATPPADPRQRSRYQHAARRVGTRAGDRVWSGGRLDDRQSTVGHAARVGAGRGAPVLWPSMTAGRGAARAGIRGRGASSCGYESWPAVERWCELCGERLHAGN